MTKITFTTSTGYKIEVKAKAKTIVELQKLLEKGMAYCGEERIKKVAR